MELIEYQAQGKVIHMTDSVLRFPAYLPLPTLNGYQVIQSPCELITTLRSSGIINARVRNRGQKTFSVRYLMNEIQHHNFVFFYGETNAGVEPFIITLLLGSRLREYKVKFTGVPSFDFISSRAISVACNYSEVLT